MCELGCLNGLQLNPLECECISQDDYDSIFNHGLNDKCQLHGFKLGGDFSGDSQNVNVFNFYGPIHGKIHGLGDDDCPHDDDELAQEGETCEGFNEITGEPFPSCAEGLVCEDSGNFGIPGALNVCKVPLPPLPKLAGEGEPC